MARNRGATFLVGAAASAWIIYGIWNSANQPTDALAWMEYILLAILLGATIYSGAKWIVMK